MLRGSPADACGRHAAGMRAPPRSPLFKGIVAPDTVFGLDGELKFLKRFNELVYFREILDGRGLQGLQLRAQARIVGLQVALHAGTAPGLR